MTTEPQFGAPLGGRHHRDRPAAFGILHENGRIALVRVALADGTPPFLDLPGGAVDPGETEDQALVREFAEETGLCVSAGPLFARARQYFVTGKDEAVNNLCAFFAAERAQGGAVKIEDDHELVWVEPLKALADLRHEAHSWAVAAWLRRKPYQA